MRLLNHVYGFGAKHELLRAGIFGRVASRCLLLTCVGATKCLSLYVMKSTFIQCEQFVELTPFIGKEYSKVFVFVACSDYNVCIVELRRSKLEFVV